MLPNSPPVHPNFSTSKNPVDVRLGHPLQHAAKKVVDALTGRIGIDADFMRRFRVLVAGFHDASKNNSTANEGGRRHWCKDKAGPGPPSRKCRFVQPRLSQSRPVDSRSCGNDAGRSGPRLPSFPRKRESTRLCDHECGWQWSRNHFGKQFPQRARATRAFQPAVVSVLVLHGFAMHLPCVDSTARMRRPARTASLLWGFGPAFEAGENRVATARERA